MTKAELQKDRDEWKEEAESLQDELDSLNEAYAELEEQKEKIRNSVKKSWELRKKVGIEYDKS